MMRCILRTDKKSPFFVVGSQRTGTTLLRLMLNAHSEIAIPEEGTFWIPFLRRAGPRVKQKIQGSELDCCLRYITRNPQFRLWNLDPKRPVQRLKTRGECTLAEIISTFYDAYAFESNKKCWGDKTPSFFRMVPVLSQLFPEAKFVHLVRDGRDVYLSWRRLNPKRKNVAVAALEWRFKTLKARSDLRRLCSDRSIEMRYEDLVKTPEFALRKVCAFLGFKYEPGMLEYWKSSKEFVGGHHSELIFCPVSSKSADKWRRGMTRREQHVYQFVAGSVLERLGYELGDRKAIRSMTKIWVIVLLVIGIPSRVAKVMYTAVVLNIASKFGLETDKAGKGRFPVENGARPSTKGPGTG